MQQYKTDFPALQQAVYGKNLIYLDNAATAHMPACAVDSIVQYITHYHSNVHRGNHYLSNRATEMYEQARIIVAEYINAEPEEIIFTSGTTDGINMVAEAVGRNLTENDKLVATDMEHHSNYLPWLEAARRSGGEFAAIPMTEKGELDLSTAERLLDDRTKILALCHVSNITGTRNPIEKLIGLAKTREIPVLIDGAQGIRHERVDVKKLDCDFYCFSGHKLFGPTGIGVLYAKKDWLCSSMPVKFGGGMVKNIIGSKVIYENSPFKFEAGTPNISGAIGLAASIKYLNSLNMDELRRYEEKLISMLADGLKNMSGIKVLGNPAKRMGMVSFVGNSAAAFDIAALLDKMGIAVRAGHHCSVNQLKCFGEEYAVRVSTAFYNTEEEIITFFEALKKVLKILGG